MLVKNKEGMQSVDPIETRNPEALSTSLAFGWYEVHIDLCVAATEGRKLCFNILSSKLLTLHLVKRIFFHLHMHLVPC